MRAFLSTELPLRRYNSIDTPGAPEQAKERHRPYWFGAAENVSPQCVDVDATSGLGIYELLDPAIAPNTSTVLFTNAGPLDHLWSYEDFEAAGMKDPARRIELALTTDYTIEASTARVTLIRNPGIVRIVAGENDRLDFTANGVDYTAEFEPGIRTIHELKGELTTLMNALAGAVYTWIFNESSGGVPHHKYSVAYSGGGSHVFRIETGPNRDRSILPTIGYTGDDDLTGASLEADTAMPYDPDTTAIIRVDNVGGYRDDASGTYTGTPNGNIKLAPDIDRVLLVKVHGVDPALIGASYVTARTTCPEEQSVYLGGLTSVQGGASFALTHADVRDRFSVGCIAQIQTDEAGNHSFVKRTADIPSNAKRFYDYDYIEWWVAQSMEHVYGTVRVNFAQDPTTGLVQGREATNTRTVLLYRRPQIRTWDTFLRYEYDAANALARLAALARGPIRHPSFRVVGRGADSKVGDTVLLNRSRSVQGLDETGGLVDDAFRVLSVTKSPIDGSISYVTHTNVTS